MTKPSCGQICCTCTPCVTHALGTSYKEVILNGYIIEDFFLMGKIGPMDQMVVDHQWLQWHPMLLGKLMT
jgi:hypothetical protein